MRHTHNLTVQPYTFPTFRVSGIVQMHIGDQWCETPIAETVRCERNQARDKALARCEAYARGLDPQAVVRWHTPELVRVEIVKQPAVVSVEGIWMS